MCVCVYRFYLVVSPPPVTCCGAETELDRDQPCWKMLVIPEVEQGRGSHPPARFRAYMSHSGFVNPPGQT